MKNVSERPSGYRLLGKKCKTTEKGMQFEYYNWLLWLPKKSVVKIRNGPYCAPAWAIDSAKATPGLYSAKEKAS